LTEARGTKGLFELGIDGVARGIDGVFADVFQAIDRPDRLEAAFWIPEEAERRDPLLDLRPGRGLSAFLAGQRVFEGKVQRVSFALDGQLGKTLSVVAYADYHSLRASNLVARYYQATDSEIAERIASDLGLVAVVERVEESHSVVCREGDPLRFLRRRAKKRGFQLAVSGGKLYFGKKLPAMKWKPGEPLFLDEARDLFSMEIGDDGEGRRGRLEAAGNPGWRPLVSFEIGDVWSGPGWRKNRYRALRTLHRLDSSGYQTTVEFAEEENDP
jgi:hypothetical protein